MTGTLAEAKAALRKSASLARIAASRAAGDAAEAFRRRLQEGPPIPAGSAVSAYWPMGSELDVRPAMTALHAAGHRLCLPLVTGPARPLVFRLWTPELSLREAAFGTSEPPADSPLVEPEVLIVPLLAFDRQGFRLGYGGGFYDRTLEKLRAGGGVLAIGAAYAGQEVEFVPREATDLALDWIVTEVEAIRIA